MAIFLRREDNDEDCYGFYKAHSMETLVHTVERHLEDPVSDEVHCLRCENLNLERKVQQLESQIEETRAGLVEIFNQKIQEDVSSVTEMNIS